MKKCVAPLSSLVIDQRSKIAPCCAWNGKYKDINSNMSLTSAANLLNDSKNIAIKNKLDFTENKSCSQCINGSTQYIEHNNYADPNIDYTISPTITNLHLKVSNFCNLACRMCDPDSSSILATENNKVYNDSKHPHISKSLPIGSVLYKSILENLKNIRYLWCSGGEPLIHEEIWSIIDYCYNNNLAKNIVLKFNTNGTVILKDYQIKQLVSFKDVYFDISVDGIGDIGEYIRTKSNWNNWKINFDKYLEISKNYPNIHIRTNTAVSIFNVHVIDEIHDYFEKYRTEDFSVQGSFNPIHYPRELCVKNLPDAVKKELLQTTMSRKPYDFLSLLKAQPDKDINIKHHIDTLDNTAIASNLYKNYKRFSDIDPKWYERITNDN